MLPNDTTQDRIAALIRSIDLPAPSTIESPQVSAAYHSIYLITFPQTNEHPAQEDLVLRISKGQLPTIKTSNEVAVISWVSQNTSIPVPKIVHHSTTSENILGHEYVLLSRLPGHSLDKVYKKLDGIQMSAIVAQLADFMDQLHDRGWNHVGGLRLDGNGGEIVPGPVVEETFWQMQDIEKYWNSIETVGSLNVAGPFHSYVDYISGHVSKYIYAISKHDSLQFMLDLVPRLELFIREMANDADQLNQVKLRLAHRDLHFGNIMFDIESGRITGIIDWEFAMVVPFTRWNPVGALLWCGIEGEEDTEKSNRVAEFMNICRERGITIPEDEKFSSPKQEHMQSAANFLRAIVEVSPKGQKADLVGKWRESLEGYLTAFGV